MRISDWSSDVCSSDLDHAIFVIYSLDFMTLLVIALSLLGAIGLGSDLIAFAAMLLPPIHIYKQLRGAYELRRFSALWRTFVLLRSEEHTSELQSLMRISYAVFCLKKKTHSISC